MKLLNHIRDAVNRWLARLAEANQKELGSGRADCCRLNRHERRQH